MKRIRKEIELEIEIILLSNYCEIILKILNNSSRLSVVKTTVFAYLLKKDDYQFKRIFGGNTEQDITLKYLSTLNGRLDDFSLNLPFIVHSIDLLVNSRKIEVDENNKLSRHRDNKEEIDTMLGKFVEKAIDDSNNFSDEQFLKEVLSNV